MMILTKCNGNMDNLTDSPAWYQLKQHAAEIAEIELKDLIAMSGRFSDFSLEAAGFLLDYSYQHLTQQTLQLLINLAYQQKLPVAIEKLFAGDVTDSAHCKAGAHYQLRHPDYQQTKTFQALISCAKRLRARQWLGVSGIPIENVIHIGIGGSQLGSKLVSEALEPYTSNEINVHFIDSFDTWLLKKCMRDLDPNTTLICIASKSFATAEILANADILKEWQPSLEHWIAITSNSQAACARGIPNILNVPSNVGGRFSVWSSMALPILLCVGIDNFLKFLAGAHAMDLHYRQSKFEKNIPVILALLDIWNINFRGYQNQAIIPYDSRLSSMNGYLQQLSMESLGKSVNLDGELVNYNTGCILWGGVGSNAQHSFMQLLLQGTHPIATDFIISLDAVFSVSAKREAIANAIGNMQALAQGNRTKDQFKSVQGNQPSTAIVLPKLDPFYLGALLSIYEHKVYTQSILWHINAFDQFGVELGKRLSQSYFESEPTDSLACYCLDNMN